MADYVDFSPPDFLEIWNVGAIRKFRKFCEIQGNSVAFSGVLHGTSYDFFHVGLGPFVASKSFCTNSHF